MSQLRIASTHGLAGGRATARLGGSLASGPVQLRTSPLLRGSPYAAQRRTFFGIGEIIGVITNPSEVLRSLSESRKLLEEARQEIQEAQEKKQIPVSHTFSPLPGFFERKAELVALQRSLAGVPAFTVLFGASSVGKTALLRHTLSSPAYHVLHFDLRMAGFADLSSLYFSLANQLEGWFHALPETMGEGWGWEEFEKESWAFKHDRLTIEKRLKAGGEVKTSDISHLLELFQSALLKYWEFEPMSEAQRERRKKEKELAQSEEKDKEEESKSKMKLSDKQAAADAQLSTFAPRRSLPHDQTEARMRQAVVDPQVDSDSGKVEDSLIQSRSVKLEPDGGSPKSGKKAEEDEEGGEEPVPPPKRVPVLLIDEAHKLPALIQSDETMKALLDAMLVLTKQDRLCHVVHASSDPFYYSWLRQLNIAQHCHLLSIGDSTKSEALDYFSRHLLPHVPEKLQKKLDFEQLYGVFGGKLAHLSDYISEYINSDGQVTPLSSSHFLQAYALLQLHLVHASPPRGGGPSGKFEIYSALRPASPHSAPAPDDASVPPPSPAAFTSADLLYVMRRLQSPPTSPENASDPAQSAAKHPYSAKDSVKPPKPVDSLPYFPLCRELGVQAIDGLVRARLLELRWSRTVSKEGEGRRRAMDDGDLEAERGPRLSAVSPVVATAMRYVLHEWAEELDSVQRRAQEGEKKGPKVFEGEKA